MRGDQEPRENRRSPLIALTTAERRVAMIVGRGVTSKEAARELAVSVKTIEFHLANVFRKLGVRTRAELANLVGREEAGRPGGVGNLPVTRTSLVGRAVEVAALGTLIDERWLVTIVGTGGVGKSRLALHVAAAATDRQPDGVWLVELAGVRDRRDVIAATAAALGVSGRDDRSANAVAAALGDQRRLVVVDGCEHVLDAAAEVLDAIGRRCPGVAVLATSRERVDVDGEQVFALEPLSLDPGPSGRSPAAELFCTQAQLADWSFDVGAATFETIEAVCSRLDGLPLAIELAAARAGTIGLAAVASQLAAPLDVLLRARGAANRQLSLRATIEWSYDRLEPVERMAFDELSPLSASYDIDAARAALSSTEEPPAVDRLISSLVRRSMLLQEGERFRMLDTLRSFGAERLDRRGRTADIRRRMMDHFVLRAEALDQLVRSPGEHVGHHGFEREWHHIREALRTALELGELDAARRLVLATAWWAHSRARVEVGDWATAVLAATATTDDVCRPALLMVACTFEFLRGELVGLTGLVADARAEVERLGTSGEPWIPYVEANFTTLDPETRTAAYRELRRWTQRSGDPFWTSIADGLVGEGLAIAIDQGGLDPYDVSRAIDRIRTIAQASERGGPSGRTARARYTEGLALRNLAPDEAACALRSALELATELDLTELAAATAGALAVHLTRHGQPLAAAAVLAGAMDAARRRGAFGTLQVASLRAPLTLLALGRHDAVATVLATLRAARSGDPSIDDAMNAEYGISDLEASLTEHVAHHEHLVAAPLDVKDMSLFVLGELHDVLGSAHHLPPDPHP